MTLNFIISDVHLMSDTSKEKQRLIITFYDYVKENGHQLINLGDYFDFWRSNNTDCIIHNVNVIETEPVDAIYIIGNHDYLGDSFGYYRYKTKDKIIYTHGCELDVVANMEGLSYYNYMRIAKRLSANGTAVGSVLSTMWNFSDYAGKIWRFTRNHGDWDNDITRIEQLVANNLSHKLCRNIPRDFYVFFGHTHRQYVGPYGANPGAFPDYLIYNDESKLITLKTWRGFYEDNKNNFSPRTITNQPVDIPSS